LNPVVNLTNYQITDMNSVFQSPSAPVDGIMQALIAKAQSSVTVRVIVDQSKLNGGGTTSPEIAYGGAVTVDEIVAVKAS
jgi:hypothetical protein